MGCGGPTVTIWIHITALLCLCGGSTAQLSFSVSEEVDKGTVVGNLAKDLQINVHDLEKRNLRVVSGNSRTYFEVDLKTGALYVCDRIGRALSEYRKMFPERRSHSEQPNGSATHRGTHH